MFTWILFAFLHSLSGCRAVSWRNMGSNVSHTTPDSNASHPTAGKTSSNSIWTSVGISESGALLRHEPQRATAFESGTSPSLFSSRSRQGPLVILPEVAVDWYLHQIGKAPNCSANDVVDVGDAGDLTGIKGITECAIRCKANKKCNASGQFWVSMGSNTFNSSYSTDIDCKYCATSSTNYTSDDDIATFKIGIDSSLGTNPEYAFIRRGAQCGTDENAIDLGNATSIGDCANKCMNTPVCRAFTADSNGKCRGMPAFAHNCTSSGYSWNYITDATGAYEENAGFFELKPPPTNFTLERLGSGCSEQSRETALVKTGTTDEDTFGAEECAQRCRADVWCTTGGGGFVIEITKDGDCYNEGQSLTSCGSNKWKTDETDYFVLRGNQVTSTTVTNTTAGTISMHPDPNLYNYRWQLFKDGQSCSAGQEHSLGTKTTISACAAACIRNAACRRSKLFSVQTSQIESNLECKFRHLGYLEHCHTWFPADGAENADSSLVATFQLTFDYNMVHRNSKCDDPSMVLLDDDIASGSRSIKPDVCADKCNADAVCAGQGIFALGTGNDNRGVCYKMNASSTGGCTSWISATGASAMDTWQMKLASPPDFLRERMGNSCIEGSLSFPSIDLPGPVANPAQCAAACRLDPTCSKVGTFAFNSAPVANSSSNCLSVGQTSTSCTNWTASDWDIFRIVTTNTYGEKFL